MVFDLETTGLDREHCGIVEIGAVRVREGQVVDRFHLLLDPGQPIEEEASAVHGYRDRDVAGKQSFQEAWPRLEAFIGTDLLVAHNGREFDLPILYRHIQDAGGDPSGLCCLDTLPLARSVSTERARLEDLAARFEVPLGRAHHALDDAEVLAGVLPRLLAARVARHRVTAFPGGLDWLALGLALESHGTGGHSAEEAVFLSFARFYALSPYSSCLARYAEERIEGPDSPVVAEVIEWLGGERLRRRLERKKETAARYPSSMVRLERLLREVTDLPVDEGVTRVLEMVALTRQEGAETADRALSLLTMHATKGLEFSRVYVLGAEDGQVPGWRAFKQGRKDEFPEARRLLYVGMTRARDRLLLTRCRTRSGRETGGMMLLEEAASLIDRRSLEGVGAK